ncbi:MAG: Parvovirus coat protein VP1-like protein [Bacillus sp. (in: firmicutes)]
MIKRTQPSRRKRIGFCLPGGYRYCGPGCSGPGVPINYVDSCCKAHDNCVSKYGSCCLCDRALIRCVQAKTKQQNQEGKTARLIANVMILRTGIFCPDNRHS